jgi:hypothetical protein
MNRSLKLQIASSRSYASVERRAKQLLTVLRRFDPLLIELPCELIGDEARE